MQGATRGQFVQKYSYELINVQIWYNSATRVGLKVKFGQKNPWPECNIFVWSKVMQRSTNGQFVQEYAN